MILIQKVEIISMLLHQMMPVRQQINTQSCAVNHPLPKGAMQILAQGSFSFLSTNWTNSCKPNLLSWGFLSQSASTAKQRLVVSDVLTSLRLKSWLLLLQENEYFANKRLHLQVFCHGSDQAKSFYAVDAEPTLASFRHLFIFYFLLNHCL